MFEDDETNIVAQNADFDESEESDSKDHIETRSVDSETDHDITDDEDTEEPEQEDNIFFSKDGTQWQKEPFPISKTRPHNIMIELPGIKRFAKNLSVKVSYVETIRKTKRELPPNFEESVDDAVHNRQIDILITDIPLCIATGIEESVDDPTHNRHINTPSLPSTSRQNLGNNDEISKEMPQVRIPITPEFSLPRSSQGETNEDLYFTPGSEENTKKTNKKEMLENICPVPKKVMNATKRKRVGKKSEVLTSTSFKEELAAKDVEKEAKENKAKNKVKKQIGRKSATKGVEQHIVFFWTLMIVATALAEANQVAQKEY
ncbi:hypothetical protein FQA39_LY11158 [Lamprigera yunnana]|nr:hypothetical protein FQA39_LY11158 [Lamprigera yunnana]